MSNGVKLTFVDINPNNSYEWRIFSAIIPEVGQTIIVQDGRAFEVVEIIHILLDIDDELHGYQQKKTEIRMTLITS